MSYEKFATLVEALKEGTAVGQIEWRASDFDDDIFVSDIGEYGVELSRVPVEYDDDVYDFFIAIMDENGKITDKFGDGDLQPFNTESKNYYRMMKEMYERARRSVIGSDRVLDKILNNLRAKGDE